MKALVLTRPGPDYALTLQERPTPQPGPGEVLVRLHAAALNHRDLGLALGRAGANASYIPGSDGAGTVAAVGSGVAGWQTGGRVVINPTLACGECPECLAGEQSLCEHFSVLGLPVDGTWAEYVVVPARNLAPLPAHLDFEAAAALPLALATAWRALIGRAKLQPGETVLIHGIGGGAALYCLQIAAGMGAPVIVTSSSDEKLERARALGAAAGINYRQENVAQAVARLTDGRGVHVTVDSGGKETLPVSLAATRMGGRIVHFGVTTGPEVTLNTRELFSKQVALIGSTMSNQAEFAAAMRFAAGVRLEPVISGVFPLAEARQALDAMQAGSQFGKLVLRID